MTGARRGRDTKINTWFKFCFVLFCFPPLVLWIKWMVFIWEDNIKNKVIAYAKNDSAAAAAKSLQSCPTLCNSIDGSPPGSANPGILQARTLEWVAISFSNAWKWKNQSEVAQLCLTLHDPMDCSLPGSSVHGFLQARVLEWGAIAFSEKWFYLVIFFFFLASLWGMLDLSSQSRDWTHAPCTGRMEAYPRTTREVPTLWLLTLRAHSSSSFQFSTLLVNPYPVLNTLMGPRNIDLNKISSIFFFKKLTA